MTSDIPVWAQCSGLWKQKRRQVGWRCLPSPGCQQRHSAAVDRLHHGARHRCEHTAVSRTWRASVSMRLSAIRPGRYLASRAFPHSPVGIDGRYPGRLPLHQIHHYRSVSLCLESHGICISYLHPSQFKYIWIK